MLMSKTITLKDLDIRCENLKKEYPENPTCSFTGGCDKPVDVTPGMGIDTSCPYHRLLFDYWMYEVLGEAPHPHKATRRRLFREWTEKIGKDECDRIVLEMANDGINWTC